MGAALALLVFPVSSHSFLGDAVHLFSAYLDFEWLAFRSDDRSVERLVEVVARCSNPILNSSRDRLPVMMNYAQRGITMSHFVRRHHTSRHQIINLIELDLLTA